MSEDVFWKLIDGCRKKVDLETCDNGDEFQDRQAEYLKAILRQVGPEVVRRFQMRFVSLTAKAYRWDIWGAAYWLHGGCGDDGFMDFRANLVSLGRRMYEKVLKNPDDLADIFERPDVPFLQGEGFGYTAGEVYKELTGESMNLDEFPKHPREPEGKGWDFDDPEEVAKRFPKLFKKLPNGGS